MCPYNPQSICYVQKNSYGKTYNSSWRNQPNFGWRANQQQQIDQGNVPQPHRGNPPDFHQNCHSHQQQHSQQKSQQATSSSSALSIESLLKEYINKNDAMLQSQATTIRNLEIQMGQIAGELKNRLQGALPSTTNAPRGNRKEHCQVVTLRSGKTLSIEMHNQGSQTNLQPSTFLRSLQERTT